MLLLNHKLLNSNRMSLLAFMVWAISTLAWFSGWNHVMLVEGFGLLLLVFALNPILAKLALVIHGRKNQITRSLSLALNDRRELDKLSGIPRDVLSKDFIRWSRTRTAYLLAVKLIADMPIVFYIAAVIIPGMPSQRAAGLILAVQTGLYFCISTILTVTEQMNLNGRLRRLLALELVWPEFAEVGLPSPPTKNAKFLKSVLAVFSSIVIIGSFGALWTRMTSDSYFPIIYSIAFLGMCFIWVQEKNHSQGLSLRLDDFQVEFSKGLRRDVETQRMSSLGQMTGLVIHDLAQQIASLKLSLESQKSFAGDRRARDVHDVHDVHDVRNINLDTLMLVSNHMEGLLGSLRAKLKNPGSPPVGRCRMGDAVDYAAVLLRISERVQEDSRWHFQVSYEARELMIALPQSDLIQILMNLGLNAIRATKGKSGVKFKVAVASRDEKFVTFALSDNGTGLTPERFLDLTAIADLGFNPPKIREGLGLRLVCRMVESAGGAITVAESSDATGTEMYMKLPLA